MASSTTYNRDYYLTHIKPARQAARTAPARVQLRGATKRINLRIPDDLHAALVASAAANHRSLNAELVARLESR